MTGGGLLGHGDTAHQTTPKLVESLLDQGEKVVSVAVGELHTVVLTDLGEVLSCGVGEYGRQGNGFVNADQTTFEKVEIGCDFCPQTLGPLNFGEGSNHPNLEWLESCFKKFDL